MSPPPDDALFSTLTRPRDPQFVQRRHLFDSIRDICLKRAGRVALLGPKGVGKTHLAIELGYNLSQKSHISVFWIDADSPSKFWRSLREIAQVCGIPSHPDANVHLQSIHNWLQSFGDKNTLRWCIIIDGSDDYDVPFGRRDFLRGNKTLADYIPKTENGCVITTTSNQSVASALAPNKRYIYNIGPMERKEALVLYHIITRPPPTSDIWMLAGKVVKRLQYHALDIAQASTYIRQNHEMEKDEFINAVRNRDFSLTEPSSPAYQRTLAETWWNDVFTRIASNCPSASRLLSLMGCFDDQVIPKCVLQLEGAPREGVANAVSANVQPAHSTDDDIDHYESLGINFEDDMSILIKRYLVTANEENDNFEMHCQVQVAVRAWLQANGQLETYQQEYIARIARALPAAEYRYLETGRIILPHLARVLDYDQQDDACQLQRATVLHNGSWCAMAVHDFRLAEELVSKSIEIRKKLLGEVHDMTLESESLRGLGLFNMESLDESKSLQNKTLETLTVVYGENNHVTLRARIFLMLIDSSQGFWNDAISTIEQVTDKMVELFGEEHDETLVCKAILAHTYRLLGRYDDAEELAVQIRDIRIRVFGMGHPSTLAISTALASIYIIKTRYLDAQQLQAPLIPFIKKVYGETHAETVIGLANLALSSANMGIWEDVNRLEDSMLDILQSSATEGHGVAMEMFDKVLEVHAREGDPRRAEMLQREIVAICKHVFGDKHTELLYCYETLTNVMKQDGGRLEELEEYETKAVNLSTEKLGLNSEATMKWIRNLAETKRLLGQHEEAMSLIQQCAELRQKTLGPEHPDAEEAVRTAEKWDRQRRRWSWMRKIRLSKG